VTGREEGQEASELAAGQRFIDHYNYENCTDYGSPKRAGDPPDLVFHSPSGLPDLEVEHTRVDFNQYQALAATGNWQGHYGTVREAFAPILATVDAKVSKYPNKETRAKFILLLDTFPSMAEHWLDQLREEEAETLANAGFKEIWYVDRCMEPRVRRLV
jgi:hypothetical protein